MTQPLPLSVMIEDHARRAPGSLALLAPGKKPLTYRELEQHIRAVARRLQEWGLAHEDRVAVVLPNGPEMAAAFLAVASVCACAPLNPAYSADEFAFYLSDLGAKALICSHGGQGPERTAAGRLNIPLIELEADLPQAGLFTLISGMSAKESVSVPEFSPVGATALVLHTSGTTSRPKIVPLAHANLAHGVDNTSKSFKLTSADRALNLMPLFHIHGLVGVLSSSMAAGGSVVCTPGLRQDEFMAWLSDFEPTWFSAVPTLLQAIAEVARENRLPPLRLRFIRSASSALPFAVAQELEALFGAPVLEAYGMTEASHQIAANPLPPLPRKAGSVGLPAGATSVAILDEYGSPLPGGEIGEICIRGASVITGYENNPEANARAFTGGWLRTGDLGYIDADGYIFISGRSKEMINRGGEKIAPREVEEVLLKHLAVAQAVAFGVPHPTLGEDVAAAVVLRPGWSASARELRQAAAASLADFKVPRQIVFLPEIPKGATGKVQRIGLAEKLADQLEASRARPVEETSAAPTPLEAAVLAIWHEVLADDTIGVHDDFLDLGGDSIRAMRILGRVNERFGLSLTMRDLFETPTVADIAGLILETQGP